MFHSQTEVNNTGVPYHQRHNSIMKENQINEKFTQLKQIVKRDGRGKLGKRKIFYL
jgi:hypothetical protein